jgi:hypothetical protein
MAPLHGAVPHDAMQKWSNCEIFVDLIYFALKFSKRVNYSHFHKESQQNFSPRPTNQSAAI